MNEDNRSMVITEIVNEYGRIDKRWLKLHYSTSVFLVLFGFLVECALGALVFIEGYSSITSSVYIIKYIMIPFCMNLTLLLAGFIVLRHPKIKQGIKVYTISLLFVGVCFVLLTVHSMFNVLYFIFAVPVLLTVVYSDYILTTITAVVGIFAKVLSELFIEWDPHKYRPLHNELDTFNFIISICILVAFLAVCIIVIRFEREKNSASIQKEIERFKMRKRLVTDELTQIYNRTALRTAFQDMECDKTQNNYIFVMMDMDNFKTINDTLGHHKGDDSLKVFGGILRQNCGDAVPIRFGGDEFCMLFKNKSLRQVTESCKNIQKELRESCRTLTGEPLTVSIGIASYSKGMTASQLLKNSDIALYKAKEHRDTVCVYEQD